MANGGFLRSPRVRVFWGDINLSSYNGNQNFPANTPVVYDVRVDLSAEGDGPTGEMKWDPTGPGGALYEWFVTKEEYMKKQITVEYFYPRGKKIVFIFVWSGQSINYGNDMAITVKLTSELTGLVNANQRSTAQAYDETKGAEPTTILRKAQDQFGLNEYKDLLSYNEYSLEYANKVKILNTYGNDWTFGNAVGNIAKQTGDMAFAHNIGKTGIVIMPPYSWAPKGGKSETVLNGATDIAAGQAPDPKKRYGYLLGPSVFNSITRTAGWKPPQQDNANTPGTQTKVTNTQPQKTTASQNPPTSPQVAQSNQKAAAKPTSSPVGTANGRANPGVQNKENPFGPDRQNALNDEKSSELSMDTLMCPLLVGLKPHDILFIPSLSGSYIEDWIVQSVDYTQSNGEVTVGVRATRPFATSSPMNKTALEEFKKFAESQGLIGKNATLDSWDRYSWSLSGEFTNI